MTGAFFRVERGGKFCNVQLEHLTADERKSLLSDRSTEYLLSCLDLACEKLCECEQIIDMMESQP